MKVATAPISWGACEIPEWGEVLPYARVLDEMSASGYAGTELGPPDYLPRDAKTLARELAARRLAMVGAFCPVPLHDPERRISALRTAAATARLVAELGGSVLVLAAEGDDRRSAIAGRVPADGSASLDERGWGHANALVDRVARNAREHGVTTAFHPHAASYVEAPHEIERLLAGTDPALVGLCLDTGHVAYGGADPALLAKDHGARVKHVHLKDLRRRVHQDAVRRGIDFRDAVGEGVFAPLGDGDLDLRGTLDELRDAGYDGWLVVEQDIRLGITPEAAPLADALRSREFIRQAIGA
jgi:inosose dehydratase